MPSFLIVGSTGNTGGGVVKTLSELVPKHKDFSNHRIIALTRDATGHKAKQFATIGNVEVIEKDWRYIDSAWLREHDVQRVFIACPGGVTHFTDESLFLVQALEAGVKYLVRISTTRGNVGPTTPVFYGRNHWAIENLLAQPEFESMAWTSLQPTAFSSLPLYCAVPWVNEYRTTGKKSKFVIVLDEHAGVALVDPEEVGIVAGHLLAESSFDTHNGKKYVVVGPSNISGKQIVEIVEKHAGTTVDEVEYRDTTAVYGFVSPMYPEYVLPSLSLASRSGFNGGSSIEQSPTSPEVLKLYTLKASAAEALEQALSSLPK